jgi:hypothetical protein
VNGVYLVAIISFSTICSGFVTFLRFYF